MYLARTLVLRHGIYITFNDLLNSNEWLALTCATLEAGQVICLNKNLSNSAEVKTSQNKLPFDVTYTIEGDEDIWHIGHMLGLDNSEKNNIKLPPVMIQGAKVVIYTVNEAIERNIPHSRCSRRHVVQSGDRCINLINTLGVARVHILLCKFKFDYVLCSILITI